MSMQNTTKQFPDEVAQIGEEECYFALIDETYSSHDGYSEREGGGFRTTRYIKMERLGNREQALGWLQREEDARQHRHYSPKVFKIVIMKPVQVNRTVTFNV